MTQWTECLDGGEGGEGPGIHHVFYGRRLPVIRCTETRPHFLPRLTIWLNVNDESLHGLVLTFGGEDDFKELLFCYKP